jgi:hypothetical protein
VLSQRDALRALLRSSFDYAGLFPPAACAMEAAGEAYRVGRRGAQQWMLGSFVVTLARAGELIAERDRTTDAAAWPISVLVGTAGDEQAAELLETRPRWTGRLVLGSLEVAPLPPEQIPGAARRLPSDVQVFFESPVDERLDERLEAIAAAGACAKVRMGGVTPDAFPPVSDVARFLVACRRHGLPFKATAGLHHPLRGLRPVTYEPDSPLATMHGFLNLAVGAALLAADAIDADRLPELLAEESVEAFRFAPKSLAWRDHEVSIEQVERCRRSFFCSIGSCSFAEPVADLEQLGLLESVAAAEPA